MATRPVATETSVAELARRMAPQWRFPNDWLAWPPDAFLFTSTVLRLTGCYRHVIDPAWVRGPTWQWDVERCARQWLGHTDSLIRGARSDRKREPRFPKVEPLCSSLDCVRRLANSVSLERIRALSAGDHEAGALAQALITIHAIADATCSGFGLIGRSENSGTLAAYVGNLLLTAYGSLSSLGKHHGLVLPKMRTPQSGLTLRSLSHHLTYHTSEVEVMWRALPWPSTQENTINVLLVPWPFSVRETSFVPAPETFGPARYFQYVADQPNEEWPRCVEQLVAQILDVNRQVGRLHVVVLPELALTREQYQHLLLRLRQAHERSEERLAHVPMVIAGVQVHERALSSAGDAVSSRNEVFLATYFAGRWYELSQRKHHRWKVDRNQVRQYRLEGRLATARHWYEQIPISQRRLTFVTSSGWLTFCPLICEDLAQLEPVSDLIRGVGPTLLTALLMDGPQLRERWSARYASVFADDPGTAVLTLTSTGMVERSCLPDGPPREAPRLRTIGLWRDQPSGWRLLDVPHDNDTLLLTISSGWAQEFTADGRSDHSSAAVFRFEGARPLSWLSSDTEQQSGPLPPTEWSADSRPFRGWADIRELSAATFALDAVLQLRGRDVDWILEQLTAKPGARHRRNRMGALFALINDALTNPRHVGIDAATPSGGWPTSELSDAASVMGRWPWHEAASGTSSTLDYWTALVEHATAELESARGPASHSTPTMAGASLSDSHARVTRVVALITLSAIHARLEGFRWAAMRPPQHDPRTARRANRAKPREDGADRHNATPPEQRRVQAGKLLRRIEALLEAHG